MPYKQLYETDVITRKSPMYQEEVFDFWDDDYGFGTTRDGLAVFQQLTSHEAVHARWDGEMIIPYHAVIAAAVFHEGVDMPIAEDIMCGGRSTTLSSFIINEVDGEVLTPIELTPEFSPKVFNYTGETAENTFRLNVTPNFEVGVDADLHIVAYYASSTEISLDNPEITIENFASHTSCYFYIYITEVGVWDINNPVYIEKYTLTLNHL